MIKPKDLLCELEQGERIGEDIKRFLEPRINYMGVLAGSHFDMIIEDDLVDSTHAYAYARGETPARHGILTGIT